MFTRCPSCRAAFSITQQQLEIAAGMVRCGMCEHVFDSKLFLFDQPLEDENTYQEQDLIEKQAIENVDIELHPDDHSAIDLEVLDRELHDQEPKNNNEITDLVDESHHTEQEAIEVEDEQLLDEPVQEDKQEIPKIIADQVSNLDQESSKINVTQWLGSLTVIALIAVLSLQVVAAMKVDLIPNEYKQHVCQWLKCTIKTPRAVNRIEVLNRSIFTHPTEPDALMVTLTIVNRAEFLQPYPIIQLRFLNVSGEVIAARRFSANHYLQQKWAPQSLMAVSSPLSIQLEVHDVGEEVVSYDFDFL